MGATLHRLVEDARLLALDLRDHHERLARLIARDPLTDLTNRRGFADASQRARDGAVRTGQPFSLLYVDLDRFKELNDSRGHDVGDLLLVEVAERLRSLVRTTDTVARLGGDEFAVLALGSEPSRAIRLAARIEAALALPYRAAPGFRLSASVGLAHSCEVGVEPEDVLSAADTAMFARKRDRRRTEPVSGPEPGDSTQSG